MDKFVDNFGDKISDNFIHVAFNVIRENCPYNFVDIYVENFVDNFWDKPDNL